MTYVNWCLIEQDVDRLEGGRRQIYNIEKNEQLMREDMPHLNARTV